MAFSHSSGPPQCPSFTSKLTTRFFPKRVSNRTCFGIRRIAVRQPVNWSQNFDQIQREVSESRRCSWPDLFPRRSTIDPANASFYPWSARRKPEGFGRRKLPRDPECPRCPKSRSRLQCHVMRWSDFSARVQDSSQKLDWTIRGLLSTNLCWVDPSSVCLNQSINRVLYSAFKAQRPSQSAIYLLYLIY